MLEKATSFFEDSSLKHIQEPRNNSQIIVCVAGKEGGPWGRHSLKKTSLSDKHLYFYTKISSGLTVSKISLVSGNSLPIYGNPMANEKLLK